MKKFIFVITILVSLNDAYCQSITASSLLELINKKSIKAKDYSVDAAIKVDLPFLKMLPINAKIYFKQKDKFKIVSKSISILPRQSFDQLTTLLQDPTSFSAMFQNSDTIGKIETKVVSIIPFSDTTDLILGRLWIDPISLLVFKSQLTTKSNGTILTEYFYGSQSEFGLPDKMIFTVDIKKFKIPKSVTIDINNSKPTKEVKDKKGKIFISLNNYLVNKGISDSVFDKKKE